MKEVVRTETAPAPFQGAPYSQAIKANGFVFVAGQVGIKPDNPTPVGDGIREQTEQTLANLRAILEAAGSGMDKLVSMGARIILCDPHRAVVTGPCRLRGQRMESPDIRAGMSMLLASLCAEGPSTIGAVHQIDKGYERIDERLRALGAQIERTEG